MNTTDEINLLKNEVKTIKETISKLLLKHKRRHDRIEKNYSHKKDAVQESNSFHDWMEEERRKILAKSK